MLIFIYSKLSRPKAKRVTGPPSDLSFSVLLPYPYLKSQFVPTSFHMVPSAVRLATLWRLLWRWQPGQNKGRTEKKQPQTRAPGRALSAKSGLAAEARAISVSVRPSICASHLHTGRVYIQEKILIKSNKQAAVTHHDERERNRLLLKRGGYYERVWTCFTGAGYKDGWCRSLWSEKEKQHHCHPVLVILWKTREDLMPKDELRTWRMKCDETGWCPHKLYAKNTTCYFLFFISFQCQV